MSTYNVNTAKHAVLTPSTVDVINLTNSCSFLIVANRTTTGDPIFFTYGDAEKGVATPVAEADDNYIAGPGMTVVLPGDGSAPQVKIISDSAQAYSVQVI
jgi:hypothetical protein